MNDEVQRDLGYHAAKIEELDRKMASVQVDVTEIKEILQEARGGYKTLLAVGGLGGAIGAVGIKAIAWLKGVV